MFKSEKTTINGHSYECTAFPAVQGLRLQYRLAKMIAPGLSGLKAFAPAGTDSLMDADIGVLAEGVRFIVEAIVTQDPEAVLIQDLLCHTQRDGKVLNAHEINVAYAANYHELISALMWVVQVNGFFGIGSTGLQTVLQRVSTLVQTHPAA